MTPLYLTRIDLSEFRTFARLEVELAPRPGILIVHGSNGLGKSSLFDAIEWTLTDEIDHFSQTIGYEKFGKYLCRHGKKAGPTSAALGFSDGSQIERQLATTSSKKSTLKGPVEDITNFLRRPDWTNPISRLDRYLLLTHILGQSTLSRLSSRKSSDRFQILEEVSKSAELQRFGNALHGPGTTLAARAYVSRIAILQKNAADLKVVLDSEAEAWDSAQMSGALDAASDAALSKDISAQLETAWPLVSREDWPDAQADLTDPNVLQDAIDRTEGEARTRDFAITEARRLLDLRKQYEATLAGPAQAAVEAEKDIEAAAQAVNGARDELALKQLVLEQALKSLTDAREQHLQYCALLEARSALEQARQRVARTKVELDSAGRAFADANAATERLQRLAQIETRIRGEIASLDNALSLSADRSEAVRQWLAHNDVIALKAATLIDTEAANPTLAEDLVAAEGQLAEAWAAEAESRQLLKTVQSSVEALSVAVSSVAAHLPEDRDRCPVCDTQFDDAADLKALADAAAARLAPVVAGHQALLVRTQDKLAAAQELLSGLIAIREGLESLRKELAKERHSAESILDRWGWAAGSTTADMHARLKSFDEERHVLETRRGRRTRWRARLASRIVVSSEATRRRDDSERARDAAARLANDAAIAERLAVETFDARATQLFPGEDEIELPRIETACEEAETKLGKVQASYDAATRARTEAELRLSALQQAEANLRGAAAQAQTARTAAETSLAALSPQWQALGWADEDMVQETIEASAAGANRAKTLLASAQDSLRRLRAGREASSRQSAHKSAFERLLAQIDLAPNSTREQVRGAVSRKLKAIEEETRATTEAKAIASDVSAKIADAVDRFNSDYIKPLDALTKRINRAILCDERISINYKVGKRRITQSAGIDGQLSSNMNVDPALIHSEGQMAALAVSMMCAASLTYPWSRWRALVFDDPLQHNDAIHASAFADLIANLVQVRDYQVLISTHDLGQAEFLRRKFEARGLPCAVLNLLGLGKAGVEWEFLPDRGLGAGSAAASA